jgi:hypothetical protein
MQKDMSTDYKYSIHEPSPTASIRAAGVCARDRGKRRKRLARRQAADMLYAYTVFCGAIMHSTHHSMYRQTYQPSPAVKLPRWLRGLWAWL